jgi:drug/metabolite transporter (DMT)-like permease
MSARTTAYLALIFAELIFGAMLVIIKPALSHVAATEFLFLRYLIILPVIIPLIIYQFKNHGYTKENLPRLIIHEFLLALNLLIVYMALEQVSALQASLLITIRPIFITIAGLLLLKEKEDGHEYAGLVISTIGATLVASGPFTEAQTWNVNFWIGLLILTNIFDALLTVNFKKRLIMMPKMSLNTFHISFSLLFYTILNVPNFGATINTALNHPYVLGAALFTGLLGSIAAALASIYGFSKIEISEATLFSYIKPIVYIPLAIFWLHETVNVTQIIGLFIIVCGVTLAEVRHPRKWFHRFFKRSQTQEGQTFYLRH